MRTLELNQMAYLGSSFAYLLPNVSGSGVLSTPKGALFMQKGGTFLYQGSTQILFTGTTRQKCSPIAHSLEPPLILQ